MSRLLKTLIFSICFTSSPLLLADEVLITSKHLTLNANLSLTEESAFENIVLITHGTLAHNGMELIEAWQELLYDEGVSSLAINLSLGIDNRHGMYECETPHTHKHSDALNEIDEWVKWLKSKGSQSIILAGHSRGGNQIAWYSQTESDPTIKGQILLAPQTWSEEQEKTDYLTRYNQPLAPILSSALQKPVGYMLTKTDFIYCPDTQVSATSFVNYYQPNLKFDTPYLLHNTTLPSLIISGSEDKTVPDLKEKMLSISNTSIKTIQIEGADHFFRDLYMDDVVEHSLNFIGKL